MQSSRMMCRVMGMGRLPLWQLPVRYQSSSTDVTIGFGKHKGRRLSEVPRQYVEWMRACRLEVAPLPTP